MLARIALAATALAIAVSAMPSTSQANGYHRRHAVVATRACGDRNPHAPPLYLIWIANKQAGVADKSAAPFASTYAASAALCSPP